MKIIWLLEISLQDKVFQKQKQIQVYYEEHILSTQSEHNQLMLHRISHAVMIWKHFMHK